MNRQSHPSSYLTNYRASASQLVQRQATKILIPNGSITQRKIADTIRNSSQIGKATAIQRMARQAVGGLRQVAQRNKHKKRFLNVITLGIRKAYVNNKRANRAAQNGPVHIQPLIDPVEEFATAYEKSRYYHKTHADNLNSIDQTGLLNYTDRQKILGHDVGGMSMLGGEFAGDEKKGVFLGPKKFMVENKMTNHVIRAFLPADRTKTHMWFNEDQVPSHELMYDEKFRGGAVITKDSIFGPNVSASAMGELLENDDPKLQSILAAVATHYEGNAPDVPTMKNHLRSAIHARRLSNAAFDNV
ncbi:hypothetical protein [Spirosoma sp.]|uniref:hypothetical protein n=1 Tax=Spirosoma sp. TaxID=1899569 RepID=UPI002613C727|nr:hypothetical protein [Spirosoma sp.]MCX6219081.1 hypothetical protein [Spirosoma sp.]